jgi:DNA mismatch repair protein MutH
MGHLLDENPPGDIPELLRRACLLQGQPVGEIARRLRFPLATEPRRGKGQIGTLAERALGASARNQDGPDFPHLSVELKTIPLDALGRGQQSTFVCALDLHEGEREEWPQSRVRRKLGCVLWLPVEAADHRPLAARRFGRPKLWRPDEAQETLLRADWTFLVGRIAVGRIEEISGHMGRVLQIRPKALHGSARAEALGPDGERLRVVPRGFYLRARFTEEILWR